MWIITWETSAKTRIDYMMMYTAVCRPAFYPLIDIKTITLEGGIKLEVRKSEEKQAIRLLKKLGYNYYTVYAPLLGYGKALYTNIYTVFDEELPIW